MTRPSLNSPGFSLLTIPETLFDDHPVLEHVFGEVLGLDLIRSENEFSHCSLHSALEATLVGTLATTRRA